MVIHYFVCDDLRAHYRKSKKILMAINSLYKLRDVYLHDVTNQRNNIFILWLIRIVGFNFVFLILGNVEIFKVYNKKIKL